MNLAHVLEKTGKFLKENGAYIKDDNIHIERVEKKIVNGSYLQATVVIALES